MLQRWWGAGVLMALVLAWLVLEERNAAPAAVPLKRLAAQSADPVGPARRGDESRPAVSAAPLQSGRDPAEVRPAAPRVAAPALATKLAQSADPPASPGAPPAGAQPGRPPEAGTLADVERAAALVAAGEREAAAELLRRNIRESGDLAVAARAGFLLAPLLSNAVEVRQYLAIAVEQDVVRAAEYEQLGTLLRELNAQPRESLQKLLRTESWTVRSGDSLWKLCNRDWPASHGVSPETGLVRLINGLTSDNLKIGQSLLVPLDPLVLKVDASEHALTAWLGNVLLGAWRVGLGRDDRTPRRDFRVDVKQKDPVWYHEGRAIPFGDPDNLLGTRWIGFEAQADLRGFGIHGTWQPESIGGNESLGCVRLRNGDVEELFELVAVGTQVSIR